MECTAHSSSDAGADGDVVSSERSARSECFLGIYLQAFKNAGWTQRFRASEIQPMVLDISDGWLNKIVLNRSGPFTDTGRPLDTRLPPLTCLLLQ